MPLTSLNRCQNLKTTTQRSPAHALAWPHHSIHAAQIIRIRQSARPVRVSAVLASSAVVDDKSVPEEHKGLHTFLYGQGGAEEHDRGTAYTARKGEDDGSTIVPVPAYLEARDGEKPIGVYCLYDSAGAPQYIGYSRNMVLAIKGHLSRVGPERCASVRAMVYGNRAMASRTTLERGVDNWVSELPELAGAPPPGNADPTLRAAWEGAAAAAAAAESGTTSDGGGGGGEGGSVAAPAVLDRRLMSPAELAAYEDKKLKMRKAMGEKMVEGRGEGAEPRDEAGEDDPETRRRKLMMAMNRGDWSAVIHAQTQETLPEGSAGSSETATAEAAEPAAAEAPSSGGGDGGEPAATGSGGGGAVVSPFTEGGAGAASVSSMDGGADGASGGGASGGGAGKKMTVEAVQAALEEVRPYLMADGGDVEVVDVEDGIVYLRLTGACNTCPSQSATMKGGIERIIRQTFGDQVRDIMQLDKADPKATVEQVDQALNMLRGAIHNYGGVVEVLSVEGGVATLRYKGPPAIGKGIQGALRDSFRDIKEIRLVD